MTQSTLRTVVAVTLLVVLAACSQPPRVATLAGVAANAEALSSFVALVDALEIDLDAATQAGRFTVFAPSNALLDAYASELGYDDAAALRDDLDAFGEGELRMLRAFVAAHMVVYAPGLMTEAFLTDDIEGDAWYWGSERVLGEGAYAFTEVFRFPPRPLELSEPLVALPEGGDLGLYFEGYTEDDAFGVDVFDVEFLAADVAFDNGIVHVIDGSIGFGRKLGHASEGSAGLE
jgi:hypothetical protein